MKKWCVMLLSAFWLVGLLGCSDTLGNEQAGQELPGSGEEGGAPIELDMMTFSFSGGGWPEDHVIVRELNKRLNMRLNIEWIPMEVYGEKMNVLAASNDFPDVFLIEGPEYNKWKDKGVFMDIKPELTQYPNFTKYLSHEYLELMNPKGKMYGLPFYITNTRDSLIIRKDWLDKLGLKAPATVDEFLAVAKAFALKDPDGNGKPDTSGFSFSIVGDKFTNLDALLGAFGLGNEWSEQDGRLIPLQVQTEELKLFLTFIKEAYSSGALDPEFAANKVKDPLSKLVAGKIGIATVVPNEFYTSTLPAIKKNNPQAELIQLIPPKGPDGLQATHTIGNTSKIVINAKIEPAKQQKALELLNYLLSDEGYDLIKNGIEGIHFQRTAAGKFEKLEAFDRDRPQMLSVWFFRRYDPEVQIRKWDDPKYAENVMKFYETNAKYRWKNPAEGLSSETFNQKGSQLQGKWMKTITKVAMGQLPLSAVDEAAAAWKREGGSQIIQEINEEYQKTKE
ncbi:extracellular solute-binding protein [Paenibacillus peoriae]|uniref:extracellular solute-binding protein n=1 Tax=Paenibacillus peoriae TaxID=59893 RepID=UPI00026C6695|nr:extracellular solute-binding protein [Paenibacillus peoriae]MEC0184188.1 extracellular solute-binding protein [Paenibacillus peoriae]